MSMLISAQAVDAYTLTTGRLVGTAAAFIALAGVVIGVLALARRGRIGSGRRASVVALAAGLAGLVTGGIVVAAADGGPGAGYGIVGGYVALVLGLIAAVLGGMALSRARQTV